MRRRGRRSWQKNHLLDLARGHHEIAPFRKSRSKRSTSAFFELVMVAVPAQLCCNSDAGCQRYLRARSCKAQLAEPAAQTVGDIDGRTFVSAGKGHAEITACPHHDVIVAAQSGPHHRCNVPEHPLARNRVPTLGGGASLRYPALKQGS